MRRALIAAGLLLFGCREPAPPPPPFTEPALGVREVRLEPVRPPSSAPDEGACKAACERVARMSFAGEAGALQAFAPGILPPPGVVTASMPRLIGDCVGECLRSTPGAVARCVAKAASQVEIGRCEGE